MTFSLFCYLSESDSERGDFENLVKHGIGKYYYTSTNFPVRAQLFKLQQHVCRIQSYLFPSVTFDHYVHIV